MEIRVTLGSISKVYPGTVSSIVMHLQVEKETFCLQTVTNKKSCFLNVLKY